MKRSESSNWSDLELLEKYREGRDTEWLGHLLERYFHLIFGVCMKFLKNEEEAKDHTQQICLKILQIAHREKITYFKSWLYQVTKNHCLMHLRKTRNVPVSFQSRSEWTPAEIIKDNDEADNKERLLEKEKQYLYLERAIKLLNEEQKNCIELFYFQKMTYQGIADKTGYSLMQVKSHIQNGKRNLKMTIDQIAKEEEDKKAS